MAYKITYNNFGSEGSGNTKWTHIRIANYSSSPLFADDTQTHWTTEHTISGTALLNVVENDLLTSIDKCRTHLSKVGRNLVIKEDTTTITSVGNNDFDKVDGLALPYSDSSGAEYNFAGNTDAVGFPKCDFEINEFYGTANAMVSFTFTWVESMNDGSADEDLSYSVLSHVWKQTFTIAEGGLQTWRVNGTLRIKPYAPVPGTSGSADLGRNPDSYRNLVMPSVPPTFRLKSMEWATNQQGDTLLYSLVFQEHARRLPSPAKRGSGSFTFKKMLDAGAGLLGIKTFEAELEGGANAKTTDLLASLLDASTKRIQWTGATKDLITSLTISERDIFSKKVIGLRVTAQGLDTNVTGLLRGGSFTNLNFGILGDFVTDTNIATSGSEWGDALICSFKRQMFIPYAGYDGGDFPKAQLMTMPGSPHTGSGGITGGQNNQGTVVEDIYNLDEIDLGKPVPTPKAEDLLGEEFGEEAQSPDAIAHKYMNVTGIERVTIQQNIAVTSTNAMVSKHIPITTGPPDIYITSEYTLTRSGSPPPMLHFGVNKNHITVDEQTSVTAGEIDASGNRVYTRTINRTLRYLYGHGGGGGVDEGETIPITYYLGEEATLTVCFNNPVGYVMSRPFDPRTDSEIDIKGSTIWNPSTNFGETYELDFSIPVGQI